MSPTVREGLCTYVSELSLTVGLVPPRSNILLGHYCKPAGLVGNQELE
jgi:hypothetical protein